ncbi:hypothetical protein CMO96_01885 [Candidatus Woesebacteria bacterium]|nr:hypothetical protein [Candidatus Woesebacteria bacterium]
MRYSQLFGKTTKIAPKEADTASHKFLVQAGYVDQLGAGIYTLLPLGWRVHEKIENIIREELDAIGAQELGMPVLHPKSLWAETGRWDKIDPPLFTLEDRHGKELALGSTHEEVIVDLVRDRISSYRELPFSLYQIQVKFRNEMRATGGLLRVREFVMKDLYSFHEDKKDLEQYFKKVVGAYKKIFSRCGVDAIVSQASGGTIGGTETYEFQVISDVGEDEIIYCPSFAKASEGKPGCHFAENKEIAKSKEGGACPVCGEKLKRAKTIEVGHVFALGTKYSEKMGATFADKDGKKKPVEMGCYGIGIGRLMATIVETSNDDKGIIWPKGVAPYDAHLVHVEDPGTESHAEQTYEKLTKAGIDVLWDDREDVSAGRKFADSDLVGIPVRLVVSAKAGDKVEWKDRDKKKTELLSVDEVVKRLKELHLRVT